MYKYLNILRRLFMSWSVRNVNFSKVDISNRTNTSHVSVSCCFFCRNLIEYCNEPSNSKNPLSQRSYFNFYVKVNICVVDFCKMTSKTMKKTGTCQISVRFKCLFLNRVQKNDHLFNIYLCLQLLYCFLC